MQYFPTSTVNTVSDYPYGRLKCTAMFGTEFKKGKGFRSTFQTVNPKNGRLNALKTSTYSTISVQYQDPETGYFKHKGFNPNSDESIRAALNFVIEHFDLWTYQELQYIAQEMSMIYRVGMGAIITYCGADKAKVHELGIPTLKAFALCIENPTLENFQAIKIDVEGMDALKVPDFKPFSVTIREY